MIPYGKQYIDDSDIEAMVNVVRSSHLTQGNQVPQFEQALCQKLQADHAIVVNSATSALHLACMALGVNQQDEVWVPAISFVATANAARYCGATVRFIDIDPITGAMSLECLEYELKLADNKGRLPKVIIPVDLAGHPFDMDTLNNLKTRYGFYVIDDASHALGARYETGIFVGAHPAVDVSVFSFHPVKMITTGEGGVAITSNTVWADCMRLLRSHGIVKQPDWPVWYYEQRSLGFHYRMTDIQAALGISQLKKLDLFVDKRIELATAYQNRLKHNGVKIVLPRTNTQSSWHLVPLIVDSKYRNLRNALFDFLKSHEIGVQLHYRPIYQHPYYRALYPDIYLPNAERYSDSVLSLPIYYQLETKDVDNVVSKIEKFFCS